ncbi:MAG: class I mannose-6-phosphate isomerase [Chloroflexi bacterium]|nr:class I mannose-6-phosphate isomerase [Chloroflexota bacterium]MDL1941981.1 class I mannose-6-phosphate isomerase [Chloroflexi bacterium CFX2]
MNKSPFFLIPEYRDYVWGGSRLRPEVVPTAEAWIIYAGNRIKTGPYAGRALSDLSLAFGADLLGARAYAQTGNRFPVLVKILDCAQWLSLQVHPNDEQAQQLEGGGFFGKTEAWHVLEAEPNAQLIAGVKPNVSPEQLTAAIQSRSEAVLDVVQMLEVQAGDTLFMNPGTIHALGPGLLIYEIQQTSDITYRVYDWGRPETEKRRLHIEKAIEVVNPNAASLVVKPPQMNDGEVTTLTQCQYFNLDAIRVEEKTVSLDTRGESFHGLTVIEGQVQVSAESEAFVLNKFDTLLMPACCGAYQIQPLVKSRVLKASV